VTRGVMLEAYSRKILVSSNDVREVRENPAQFGVPTADEDGVVEIEHQPRIPAGKPGFEKLDVDLRHKVSIYQDNVELVDVPKAPESMQETS